MAKVDWPGLEQVYRRRWCS